jgi:hypothetical protein
MRSESGKTVEEPAVAISPETASGAYIASASSTGAWAAATASVAGASLAAGASAFSVGAGAPQATSTKLSAITVKTNERTNLDIFLFSYKFSILRCYQGEFNVNGRMG